MAVQRKVRSGASVSPSARESLIAAAVTEFSRAGFAGARVDAIAEAANVNKQLVYHYFGSKEGLYLSALVQVYAEIRKEEQSLHLAELEPRDAMAKLVAFCFDYLAAHPEFIALLTDENRSRASHIRGSKNLQDMHSSFINMLNATLQRGIRQGVFRDDFDAVNIYISIAGISYFFFSNNYTLSSIFGKTLSSKQAMAQRREHVIKFALNALGASDP